jgi:putative ABC transport system substrate-binding protein
MLSSKLKIKNLHFAIAASAFLLSLHAVAAAQPVKKNPVVAFLRPGPPSQEVTDALRDGLREMGYVEKRNITIHYRWAKEAGDELDRAAGDIAALKPDVIVASSTPAALAVKRATHTTPVVFTVVGDPVGSGLVASLARPGGTFTGLTNIAFELDAKRLELMKEAVPKISRVAVVMNRDFPAHAQQLKLLDASAMALRVKLRSVEYRDGNDLEPGVNAARSAGVDSLLIMGHPTTFGYAALLAAAAAKNRLPAISFHKEFAESGGLLAYGANNVALDRRAAYYVDKILKGAKPADLPVEQPTTFDLVINLKTAKQIGVTIPQSMLYRADKVIK